MKNSRQFNDDDGRTVADMSGIDKTPMLMPKFDVFHKKDKQSEGTQAENGDGQLNLTGKEKRSFVMGVVSAAIVVGLIFAAVFAAFILLIFVFGK